MSGATKLMLDVKGLVTAPGQYAANSGALIDATNVDVPAPGLIQKRTGFVTPGGTWGGPVAKIISTPQLGSSLLGSVLADPTVGSDWRVEKWSGSGASSVLGVYNANSGRINAGSGNSTTAGYTTRLQAAVSLRNHYLTAPRAPLLLKSNATSLEYAGVPRPPGFLWNATPLVTGSYGFLAAGYGVAYRVLFYDLDNDQAELVGAPSGRYVVMNVSGVGGYTGAARDVSLTVGTTFATYCPSNTGLGVDPRKLYYVRVYRSKAVDLSTGQPSDEMQLCYQRQLTLAEINAGSFTFTDSTPESALGAYLYTNQYSGGDVGTTLVASSSGTLGIATANDPPPISKDVAAFANCVVWANLLMPQRLRFSIIGVGATAGLVQVGTTFTLTTPGATQTFTGTAGAPVATTDFKVELGLGSISMNTRATAMNLAAAINASKASHGEYAVVATYVGNDASPGAIGELMLEVIRPDWQASVTMACSAAATIPAMNVTALSTTIETWVNGLAISKPLQGYAVPPCNYVRVGRNDAEILRVVPLRDALFIFTQDGIWWMRGNTPSDFVVDFFDGSFRLMGQEALCVIDDAIYAWGREGIARITTGGVEFIDIAIRDLVKTAASYNPGKNGGDFASSAFVVPARLERKVYFFYVATGSPGYSCTAALVYHTAMRAWTQYTTPAFSAGAIVDAKGYATLGAYAATAGSTSVYMDDRSAFTDTTNTIITSSVTWATTAPMPDGFCQWQECQLYYSPDPLNNWGGVPNTVTLKFQTEFTAPSWGQTTSVVSGNLASRQVSRCMVEPAVAIAARQVVNITHAATEDMRLSGWGLVYTPISNLGSI